MRGVIVIAAALTVAIAVPVGCGDSDGGEAAAGGSADEVEVRRLLEEMGDLLDEGQYADACGLMTKQWRSQFLSLAPKQLVAGSSSPLEACAQILASLMASGALTEDLHPKVVRTEVDGDRAVVTANPSHDDELQRAQLVREGGEWKIDLFYQSRTLTR